MTGRIYFVFMFYLALFFAVVVKLFIWQVLSSDKLSEFAERQRLVSLSVPAQRGKIISSDGSPLILNQTAYEIVLEPQKVDDKYRTIKILSEKLMMDEASILAKLNTSSIWVPIAEKVDEDIVEKIKKENIPGIIFTDQSKRYYPEASMAAHILGFVGKNAKGDDQGYFGLEGYYDEQLRGRNGTLNQETDALGNPILAGNLIKIPPENGRDLTLYLDKTIQYIIEEKLKEGLARYGAKGGSVIVMEPETGGILGMASYPAYDPLKFNDFLTENYKNPAISMFYEPGSTFKTLVMAAGINEKKITAETIFDELGPMDIGGYTINTWNQKYHGPITLTQVLQYSSNVGMVFVQKKLGSDLLFDYLERLGFGSLTGVDLQEESSPELRQKDKWYEIDYATASFGQGIAVTPLQMIRSVASIANGGNLMEPHVVKKITLYDGKIINISPKVVKRVFKREAASIVSEMMVSAVENGEAKKLKPPGFRIAGKTGTAQIAISGHYDASKTIASFVGFSPPEKPRFVMLVTLQEPTSSPWGSETAAPIFFAITRELFSYMKISPN